MFIKLDGSAERFVNSEYIESIGLQADSVITGYSFVAIMMRSGTHVYSKPKPQAEAAEELAAIMKPFTTFDLCDNEWHRRW